MRPVANALEQSPKDYGLLLPELVVKDRVSPMAAPMRSASGSQVSAENAFELRE